MYWEVVGNHLWRVEKASQIPPPPPPNSQDSRSDLPPTPPNGLNSGVIK